jgi:hypothetical protein
MLQQRQSLTSARTAKCKKTYSPIVRIVPGPLGQFILDLIQFGKVGTPVDLAGPPANERVMTAVAVDKFERERHVLEAGWHRRKILLRQSTVFPTIFEEAPVHQAGIRGVSWLTESLEEIGHGDQYGGETRPQGATA